MPDNRRVRMTKKLIKDAYLELPESSPSEKTLHRNVVFDHIDLLCRGNPIQTIHSFHFLCLLSPALSGTGISVPISIMPFARFGKCADEFAECSAK